MAKAKKIVTEQEGGMDEFLQDIGISARELVAGEFEIARGWKQAGTKQAVAARKAKNAAKDAACLDRILKRYE